MRPFTSWAERVAGFAIEPAWIQSSHLSAGPLISWVTWASRLMIVSSSAKRDSALLHGSGSWKEKVSAVS